MLRPFYLAGVGLLVSTVLHAQPRDLIVPAAESTGLPSFSVPMPSSAMVAPVMQNNGWRPEDDEPEVSGAVARLRSAMRREVPKQVRWSPSRQRAFIAAAERATIGNLAIDHPQLVVVVDRNPTVQALMILLARPHRPWLAIGGTHVSTGQSGRKYYYITPTGVFLHDGSILDYRAEGTYNENHIRGLGLRGMRVWDFGWQWAYRGWQGNGTLGQIRLEMHATDPDYLEQRIGHPASEGCIRIPATLNTFMDRHGILDKQYEQLAVQDPRFRAVLAPDRTPTPLAGNALMVIDTGLPG